MADHCIRLARAWELWDQAAGAAATPRRVDLPILWATIPAQGTVRLRRRFGRPTVDPATQIITLELAAVPGLGEVQLNGRVVGGVKTSPTGPTRIKLADGLEARNVLELAVNLGGVEPGAAWGMIALVIGPRSG